MRKILFSISFSTLCYYFQNGCSCCIQLLPRVCTGPGKILEFYLAFSRTGKSCKINAGPGKCWKSLSLVKKFSLKTTFCSIIFGFLFRKGLLLPLLCIWVSWKNISES